MIKAVFFDIDGTLVDFETRTLSDLTKKGTGCFTGKWNQTNCMHGTPYLASKLFTRCFLPLSV